MSNLIQVISSWVHPLYACTQTHRLSKYQEFTLLSIIYWTSPHRERKETSHLTQGRSHTRNEIFPNHNQAFTLETKSTAPWNWYGPPTSNCDKHYFVLQINWILKKEHTIITANNCRLLWNKNKQHIKCFFLYQKENTKKKPCILQGRKIILFIFCYIFYFRLLIIFVLQCIGIIWILSVVFFFYFFMIHECWREERW